GRGRRTAIADCGSPRRTRPCVGQSHLLTKSLQIDAKRFRHACGADTGTAATRRRRASLSARVGRRASRLALPAALALAAASAAGTASAQQNRVTLTVKPVLCI